VLSPLLRQMTTYGETGYTADRIDEVYRSVVLASQGAVPCVGKNCKAWYIPQNPHGRHAERVECSNPKCKADFCSACKQPYHYHTSCEEALRIASSWLNFLQSGHDSLLVAAVKIDELRFGPLLQAHTLGKHAGSKSSVVIEAFARFQELKSMEQW